MRARGISAQLRGICRKMHISVAYKGVLWQSLPMSETSITTTQGAIIGTFSVHGTQGAIRMTAGSYFVSYGTEEQECSSLGLAVRRMLVIIGKGAATVWDATGAKVSAKEVRQMFADSVEMFGPLS